MVSASPHQKQNFLMKNNGFTLLELSIVLAIISVITGGILVGQDMIRNATVKNFIQEQEAIHVAVEQFYDRHQALPGDMADATEIWGAVASSNCDTTASSGKPTCSGNGNGQIAPTGVAAEAYEEFRMWQHLNNAGLLNGAFNGVDDSFLTSLSPTVLRFGHLGSLSSVAGFFNGTYNHTLYMPIITSNAYLSAQELENIDEKFDDGAPALGDYVTSLQATSGRATSNCTLKADLSGAPAATDLDAVYNPSEDAPTCIFMRRNFVGR